MLTNFIKKENSKREVKTTNIEEIQRVVDSKITEKDITDDKKEGIFSREDVNKPTKQKRRKINVNRKPATETLDSFISSNQEEMRVLTDENIHNKEITPFNHNKEKNNTDASFNSSFNKEGSISFVNDRIISVSKDDQNIPFKCAESTEEIDIRKMQVMNVATRRIEILYSPVSAALYLPDNMKMLSKLYKIIYSVQSFNEKRGLSLVFIKYADSIEKLFKHRVELNILEQLNFICNGTAVFTPLSILDEGIKKNTFKISLEPGFDIDLSLFNFYSEMHSRWMEEEGITGLKRFHPSFTVEVPRKPFLRSEEVKTVKEIAKSKAESILERIKEKERQRREQFIQECKNIDYKAKIDGFFGITEKKAIKMEELIFKIGGFDIKTQILKSLGEDYYIKTINGEDYLVKKQQ